MRRDFEYRRERPKHPRPGQHTDEERAMRRGDARARHTLAPTGGHTEHRGETYAYDDASFRMPYNSLSNRPMSASAGSKSMPNGSIEPVSFPILPTVGEEGPGLPPAPPGPCPDPGPSPDRRNGSMDLVLRREQVAACNK